LRLHNRVAPFMEGADYYKNQSKEWQLTYLELFQEKVDLLSDFASRLEVVTGQEVKKTDELVEILSWETTPQIKEYISKELESISQEYVSADTFSEWMNYCKKELKIKGKPLFMGFRGVLTGQNHGPDLKVLIPLTPVSILKKRIASL